VDRADFEQLLGRRSALRLLVQLDAATIVDAAQLMRLSICEPSA
jgi:hypothetical protein